MNISFPNKSCILFLTSFYFICDPTFSGLSFSFIIVILYVNHYVCVDNNYNCWTFSYINWKFINNEFILLLNVVMYVNLSDVIFKSLIKYRSPRNSLSFQNTKEGEKRGEWTCERTKRFTECAATHAFQD